MQLRDLELLNKADSHNERCSVESHKRIVIKTTIFLGCHISNGVMVRPNQQVLYHKSFRHKRVTYVDVYHYLSQNIFMPCYIYFQNGQLRIQFQENVRKSCGGAIFGLLVYRLRHCPVTAERGVRLPCSPPFMRPSTSGQVITLSRW